jgi:hypothetical protein
MYMRPSIQFTALDQWHSTWSARKHLMGLDQWHSTWSARKHLMGYVKLKKNMYSQTSVHELNSLLKIVRKPKYFPHRD